MAARFVGRQAELATLEDELRQACNGQPRVVRIQGPSGGADKEVALAEKLGIPVFTDIEALDGHFPK